MSDFVRLDGVTRRFDGQGGVEDLSLAVPRGAFTVLLGPSGCGKSTTLRLIAGLEAPERGRVLIGGRDVTAAPPAERGLAMVFQSYALFPHLTVAENIVFGLRVRGLSRAERAARLADALALTGLAGLERRKPAQLSGGQRQRVALARAVVAGHPLCLMDEPLSNLDAKLRHGVRQEIRALQQRLGMTVVYVTHDQTEAMAMADCVVLMRDGRIEQAGAPADLYARPATAFAAGFIGSPPMVLLPGELLAGAPENSLLGIRAEDIRLLPPGDGLLQGRVVANEFLGAETFVYLDVGGPTPISARVPGRFEQAPGTPLAISWAPDAAHWFDRDAGRRLAVPTPAMPASREDPSS
ncbi:ABC transporter ATP-binding protein [Zavarzinia sp.]|uniref:ABC transporter ATP-binding protein n=1 Tax=Zavarzinia sp. TaxID=2027920 RepID=UPI00356B08C0